MRGKIVNQLIYFSILFSKLLPYLVPKEAPLDESPTALEAKELIVIINPLTALLLSTTVSDTAIRMIDFKPNFYKSCIKMFGLLNDMKVQLYLNKFSYHTYFIL